MKDVMSGAYEHEAATIQEWKNQHNEVVYEKSKHFNGVRQHTRASAMASDHVNSVTKSFMSARNTAPEMWKMT